MKTDKKCACGCGIIGTVLGIIFGIIVASLFAAGSTPLIVTAIWIAFAVAGATLILLMIMLPISACGTCMRLVICLKRSLTCLLIGTIGTVVTSIAALAIVLEITAMSMIFLIGLGTFFFTMLLSGLVSFFKCLAGN